MSRNCSPLVGSLTDRCWRSALTVRLGEVLEKLMLERLNEEISWVLFGVELKTES